MTYTFRISVVNAVAVRLVWKLLPLHFSVGSTHSTQDSRALSQR